MTSIDPFAPVELQHPGAGLSLHILPYGLIPHRLLLNVRQDGPLHPSSGIEGGGSATHDLLTGPEEPNHHQTYGRSFFGPVIGRYANRLPAGKQKYGHGQEMLVPVWGGENLCLHGGPASGPNGGPPVSLPLISQDDVPLQEGPLDTIVWTPLSNVSKAELFKDQDLSDPVNGSKAPQGSARVFAINHRPSSDGSGPPVTLRIEALIAVQGPSDPAVSSEDVPPLGLSAGKVRIEYRAEQRRSGKEEAVPTPLNLTHHWAFNLSASDPSARQTEKGTIEQHELRMLVRGKEEERTLELDSRSVPLGQLKAADGEYDFHATGKEGFGRLIGEKAPPGGHDHWHGWGPTLPKGEARTVLRSPLTKIGVLFSTDQSGVQLYCATGQPAYPATSSKGGPKKRLHRSEKDTDEGKLGNHLHSACFLEFAHPHATALFEPLQKWAGTDTLLREGRTYRAFVQAEVYEP
ncbi:hypothetical protein IE81DRAFT_319834 [Ceraceosorus guamensis]|uniref:Galactose mutarotase-like protein n=1 Tax=Ceraceosorus guamensis TaxID=1522189 RepID=A0A316WAA5_9BASI|nr:hypothetical protein IE81DRAFT_319834 [Ceraceosorus guamensis]PWN45978.1 hypothetical protein IE81DRAFT_319834 [Ceraceosorus guamensis]